MSTKEKTPKKESPSVLRAKAKKAERSRDSWKEKNHERYEETKALKARMEEIRTSRERWKQDHEKKAAEVLLKENLLKAVEEQLIKANVDKERIERELNDFKKKLSKTSIH
jgi:ferredoxin-NADP reductase